MGVVYRATRLNLDRAVAIKVMHSALPGAMEGRKRFEREAKLMARLEHPHCVSIIDYGLHGDKPYVVMELVRGRSLHDMLAEQGRFEIPRAVDILAQVASGLAHAHEQGIVHRDIKPANVMVTPKAPLGVHARILDFGLARMLGASTSVSNGVAVGTPSYMAPEQCRGDEVDARTDIYACGVMLVEMLTGKKPFTADDPLDIIKQHLGRVPPRLAELTPGDYGELEEVVARALAKSPADRYASAIALAEALDAAVAGRTAPEPTAVFPQLGSSALVPAEPSVDIPITVASSVTSPARPEPSVTDSAVRRMLPVSRMRWAVLGGLVLVGGGIFGILRLRDHLAASTPPPPDAAPVIVQVDAGVPVDARPDKVAEVVANASALASAGKTREALGLLADARKVFPNRAELPLLAGKLYFGKLWWSDGVENLRAAIERDPSLRDDPELVKTVLRGFLTTPSYDARLGKLLLELGAAAAPYVEEAARTHPNPKRRARAAALARRLR